MASKTSSKKSSSSKGEGKSKKVNNLNVFNGINMFCEPAAELESKGSASTFCTYKKDESSYDHSTVTKYFQNKYSPFAVKQMKIKGKLTVFPDDGRTYMRQQLTDNDASIDATEKLNSYDAMTEDKKTIILSEKLAGHYHQNSSITTSSPSFDPSNPDKDLSEKNFVKFHLRTRTEFWYNDEKLIGENEKIVKNANFDYYTKVKKDDADGKKLEKLKVELSLNEKEIYVKDIEKKTRILTTAFFRKMDIEKVPKNKKGEMITPDMCTKTLEDGTTSIDNQQIEEIYGIPPKGEEIGYAEDFDKLLKTFEGVQLFIRYHFHLEKINIGKNPKDATGYQNIYFLRKVDIIKIEPKNTFLKKYDNNFSSFYTDPEDLKKFSEATEAAAITTVDTKEDSDKKSFQDALIIDSSKESIKNNEKDDSDSDSDSDTDVDKAKNSDSDDDSVSVKKTAVVPVDSDDSDVDDTKKDSDSDSDSSDSEDEAEKLAKKKAEEKAAKKALKEEAKKADKKKSDKKKQTKNKSIKFVKIYIKKN